ncbi:MAG: hypothetical protein NVS4B8_10180 [Herpetosiphon sp.]
MVCHPEAANHVGESFGLPRLLLCRATLVALLSAADHTLEAYVKNVVYNCL